METATFQDRHGKLWTITLDPILLKTVKDECGIRLTDLKADPFLRLANDPVLMIEVLWLLCEEEAKTRNTSYVEFVKGITGEQLDGVVAALEVAVVNFCPSSRRSTLKSLLDENKQTQSRAIQMTLEEMTKNRETNAKLMANSASKTIKRLLESSEEQPFADSKSVTSSTGSTL